MKTIKEISHSLKNEPGALSEVSDIMGANGINILALYFTAQGEEGRLQFICNDPDRAVKIMKSKGYDIDTREVIACVVPNHPGGLNAVLKPLKSAGINVDYIYSCLGTSDITVVILGVSSVSNACVILEGNWIRVMGDELYKL
ncbi:MAG: hypothetical protein M0P57_06550 [Syntrophales bacterium]|jgi:hypothetical protein|nr:hypothetical protein [Syntrophales bacterium]MDY0044154.1 hypothetical protein [Syntrophales bacterium]